MLRNLSRTILMAAAAWFAAASALSAQQPATEPLRGDVDGDGAVTAADARIVADYLVGKPVPSGANVRDRGDVNGDGRITSVDAAIIRGFAAGRANVERFRVGAPVGEPASVLAKVLCRADVRAKTVRCDAPADNGTGGPRSIVMGEGFVKLTSSNVQTAPASEAGMVDLTFNVTLQNLIPQTIGTVDGTTVHEDSVRVFFHQKPTTTEGTGGNPVVIGDGTDAFTFGGQPYYTHAGMLAPNATTPARQWHIKVPTTATKFVFQLYVNGAVQFPKGWVDIYPPAHPSSPSFVGVDTVSVDPVAPNHTLQLVDSVRNQVGKTPPGIQTVSWTVTTNNRASVSATGLVTGEADGVDTVTATNTVPPSEYPPPTTRSGRVVIVVNTADSATTTISAVPGTVQAGDSSLITVQLKNSTSGNVTPGGGTVTLTKSTGGTLTARHDSTTGTWQAWLKSNVAGPVTVSGTVNGHKIISTATVTFEPGAAANMAVNSPASVATQSGTAGTAVAAPPGVKITDGLGNGVAGVVVTFIAPAGSGQVYNGTDPAASSASVTTNASGVATLTSWTLGTATGVDSVTASATGLTSVVFTATVNPGAPANITKSAGDAQSAVVNNNVAVAPAVTITDTHGNPVPGVSVTFAAASGGGSVTGGDATTDASGVATVGSWKLGTAVGANSLTATAGALVATFTATGTPDLPATITKTAGDEQNGTVGADVAVAPQVTVTDQHGNPVPSVTVTFTVTGGGGSVTAATPATNASGVAAVGSWKLGAGPTANTLQASVSVGTAAAVTFTAYVPPTAGNDSSEVMGNTDLPGSAGRNVLSNDVSINGGAISLTPASIGNLTTVRGGTVNLAADGTFSYLPPAGNVLRDSVEYTITDTKRTASGWIKFRFVGKVWYVESGFAGTSDGRKNTPFTGIAAAEAVAGASDTILVRTGSGVTAGGTLKAGQFVYGQGGSAFTATLNGESVTLLAAGTDPSLGALTLGSGNTLHGFISTGGITGTGFGTLAVSDVSINNTGGTALTLNNGTLTGSFSSVQSGGGTNNVSLTNVSTSGTATLGTAGDALSSATGDAVVISGGSGSFTIPAHITNATALAVNVNGKTGGTVTFSGNINPGGAGRGISVSGNSSGANAISFTGSQNISSGTATGVSLSNNTGATITFSGAGTGLDVATTTGTGFIATGGGTVEVGGSGNTVTVSGAAARAVELNGITIPAGGISFSSIASNGTTTGTAFLANNVNNTGGGGFTAGSITVAGTTGGVASRGIDVTSSSAPFTFTTASVNGTSGQGIFLSNNTAAVAVNGGSVGNSTSTTGDALSITNGNAAVTVAATLTKSTAGRIANITGRTGGATTVSGTLSCTGSCTGINAGSNTSGTIDFTAATKTLNTGANAAVTLASNGTGTVNFSNGGLAITTTSGAGFNATTSGTVTVTTGANPNTIQTQTGTALTVTDVNIGSGGLTFRSITAGTAASGPANGIRLSNTGTSGFVTVTGDGSTSGSGGTIQRTSGGDGAAEGNGVYLNGTRNVSLSFMNFNDHANNGLYGTGVRGLALNKVRFTGNNGSSNSGTHEESPVHLVASGGAISVKNSRLDGGAWNGFLLRNTSGAAPTVDSLVIANDTVSTMQGSLADVRNTGIQAIIGDGTADVRIRDNRVTYWWGNAVQVIAQGTGSATARITNNTLNQSSGALAAAGGVQVSGGNLAFNISGNTINGTDGTAISADRGSAGSFNGTINGNFVGTAGVANSGSATGTGIFAQHSGPGVTTINVTNNTIRQINGSQAVWMLLGDDTGGGGSGTINTTITGNNIAQEGTAASARTGIVIQSGRVAGDTDQMCADVSSNSITNFNTRIRPNQRFNSKMFLPGYTGAAGDVAAVTTYMQARNPGTTAVTSASTAGGGGIFNTSPAGSACPQPTL
jgi:hypothetical protein